MPRNPHYKLIITSVVSFLILGGLGWLFWRVSSEVLNSVEILSSIESRIATLENDRKIALASTEVLNKRSPDLERIGRFLIDRERPVEFIEALEKLAGSTDNEIAIDVVAPMRGSSSDGLSFRLTVEGTRTNIFRYLKVLELMPYEISVEDMAYQTTEAVTEKIGTAGTSVKSRLAILIKVKTKT